MKIAQIKINDKTIAERVISIEDNLYTTKHYTLFKDGYKFKCAADGFKGACIVERGFIKNLFKKIGE